VRRCLEEAQSKDAGRRTGTGSEVWYTRDEWARDHKVFHPHRGMLYKSGVYALKVTCLTPGDLPYAAVSRLRLNPAEGRAIDPDRMAEVSRRNSSSRESERSPERYGG
jgi:hypothetical protein